MGNVKITPVEGFAGLYVIAPAVYGDARGSFSEIFNARDLRAAGLDFDFVQGNQIRSVYGALRGMHFQRTSPQGKLIRVVSGRVYDAVVDLRRGQPSFGKWFGMELNETNGAQLLIPRGFAHGCLTLSETSVCVYLCDAFYAPGDEGGFPWNDPAVGIRWPGVSPEGLLPDGVPLRLSPKDRAWPPLRFSFDP